MKITGKELKKILKEEFESLKEDEFGAEAAEGPVQTEADEILFRLQELADGVGLALEPCVGSYITDLSHMLRGSS
jgi:hypothetical protein